MTDDEVKPLDPMEVFICGPSTATCKCHCPNGPCEHKWDGPGVTSEDGLMSSTDCSRCGTVRIDHDQWVF